LVSGQKDVSHYSDKDGTYWARLNNTPGYPGTGQGNILLIGGGHLNANEVAEHDRRSFASMSTLFATPADFGPLKGRLFGSLRANLIYRLYTGTPFDYTPIVEDSAVSGRLIGGRTTSRQGPLHTRTDLNVVKIFGAPNTFNMSLGVEVFNLFNQKDVRSVSPVPTTEVDFDGNLWQRWGMPALDYYAQQEGNGEIHDILNYWDSPREMKFSMQVKW
jgi:hypothetical protein